MLHRPSEAFAPNDPQEWVTERKYNEHDLGEMLGKFLAEREKSLELAARLSGSNWEAVYTTPVSHHEGGRYVRLVGRARYSAHAPAGRTALCAGA